MHEDVLFTWLHISDIHMGHGPTSHRWDQRLVLEALSRDAQQAPERGTPPPDAILVTGDIAFSGGALRADEYNQACEWLSELRTCLGLVPEAVFMVPGNHDVQRQATRDVHRLVERLRAGDESVDEALADPSDRSRLESRLNNYLRFVRGFAPGREGLFWHEIVAARQGLKVRLVGLNTALLAADDQDRGRLALGREQLAHSLSRASGPTDDVVLVLSHHPCDWLSDGREVASWVQARAHVHLYGHVHEADTERLRRGSGTDFLRLTAGASHSDAGEPAGHSYSIASVVALGNGRRVLRVWPRAWSSANRDFRLDASNVPDGAHHTEHDLRRTRDAEPSRVAPAEPTLADVSVRTLVVLEEIRDHLSGEQGHAPNWQPSDTFIDDVLVLLISAALPFEIVERTAKYVDISLAPTAGLFPQSHYVMVQAEISRTDDVNALIDRARAVARAAMVVMVTKLPLAIDVERYASQRGVSHLLLNDFYSRLLQITPQERIVAGALASETLRRSFNIHEVYVPPDAVPARPGDAMEDLFYDVRVPALDLVDRFLDNSDSNVLFMLGGYGSGKSALAAHLTRKYDTQNAKCRAAYFALRHLKSAAEISNIATRAHRVLKAMPGYRGQRCLVILDGLDEMPAAMDPTEKRLNMMRLLQAAQCCDKLIVTARTAYFRGLEDFWNLFAREGETGLWSDLARHIPEWGNRPAVSAVILREFDGKQIEQYVDAIGGARGYGENFTREFFEEMTRCDPRQVYRFLARNPLYLFLIVNTQPWKNQSVACFGDVLEMFVRYWLQRDVEKGPSRWMLTTQDRLDFAEAIGWWMFQNKKVYLTFDEFDLFVSDFYGTGGATTDDLASMRLDLQTTGIFACVGGLLHFTVSIYQDYFVASRFYGGTWKDRPVRLPTREQARLWLGMHETRGGGDELTGDAAVSWFSSLFPDVLEKRKEPLTVTADPTGIIYKPLPKGWEWPRVNANRALSTVLQSSLVVAEPGMNAAERVIYLRLTNKLGLHARASAKLTTAYCQWLGSREREKPPNVWLRYEGRPANPASIMGLMTLGAAKNGVLELIYWDCDDDDIKDLLYRIAAVPEPTGVGHWSTTLGE